MGNIKIQEPEKMICRCGKQLPIAKFRPFKFCSSYCRSKNWADNNREKHLSTSESWRKNNPARSNKLKKKWADSHREYNQIRAVEFRKNNKDKIREDSRRRYRRDIEKSRFQKRNNQNRRRSQTKNGTITAQQWDKIKLGAKNKCHYCRKKKKLTMDHVIPLSKGGVHCASNIVPACRSCNCSKHAKIITLL